MELHERSITNGHLFERVRETGVARRVVVVDEVRVRLHMLKRRKRRLKDRE